MEIIRCPFCSFELAGDAQLIGRRVQCCRCRKKFSVEESMLDNVENNASMVTEAASPLVEFSPVSDDSAPEDTAKFIPEGEASVAAEKIVVTDSPENASAEVAKNVPADCDDGINWVVNRILLGTAIFGAVVFLAVFGVRWCLRDSIDAAQKELEKAGYEELKTQMDESQARKNSMIQEDEK